MVGGELLPERFKLGTINRDASPLHVPQDLNQRHLDALEQVDYVQTVKLLVQCGSQSGDKRSLTASTRAGLSRAIRDAGYVLERLTYCITLTFPFSVGFRLLQRWFHRVFKKPEHPKTYVILLPSWANALLTACV